MKKIFWVSKTGVVILESEIALCFAESGINSIIRGKSMKHREQVSVFEGINYE